MASTSTPKTGHALIWDELESGATAGTMTARRIHPESGRDLFLGFRRADGRRAFLLQVAKSALPSTSSLPQLRGIEVTQTDLPGDGTTRLTVGLFLKEERFFDVFAALVADLAAHIAPSTSDVLAVHALISRLTKWQAFLENHAEGLKKEACQGLWGELHFLREVAIPRLGAGAVKAWTGPRRVPQDFQFVDCAIDVKTSMTMRGQALRIANERQLDDSHVAHLFLHHLSIEPLEGSGETLPAMVSSIRVLCAGDPASASRLEDRLIEVGFLDAHATRYNTTGYSVRETNFFRVAEGFPRLIESDLRAGVGAVSYSITVDSCRPFAVPVVDVEAVLQLPT